MIVKKQIPAFDIAPRFFDSFLMKDFFENSRAEQLHTNLPAVNVNVSPDSFVVELAAPGLKKELIKIVMDKDVLTLSYQEQQKEEGEEKSGKYLMREFSTRSFSRSFTFPKGVVNEESITAEYTNGILRLELPKREEAKPKAARQIELS